LNYLLEESPAMAKKLLPGLGAAALNSEPEKIAVAKT